MDITGPVQNVFGYYESLYDDYDGYCFGVFILGGATGAMLFILAKSASFFKVLSCVQQFRYYPIEDYSVDISCFD